jgi:hypothetical protein
MPKIDPGYIKLKQHIDTTIDKIDDIFNFNCYIQPKMLIRYRINCLLTTLHNDIVKLELYNNEIMKNHMYYPELEENIFNTKELYYNYKVRLSCIN